MQAGLVQAAMGFSAFATLTITQHTEHNLGTVLGPKDPTSYNVTGPQIMHSGFRPQMHGTPRPAHLARTLMMVALLPRGLIGGLGEDPDAVSYPESKHAST